MQGNTSAIVTIDKARQAVRGIVIGSQTRSRLPKSFSEIEVAQASIIYQNGEIFILDTARVILICFTRMRGHRLKSAWDKNFLVGVRQKAEDGETRDEGCAPCEMFRFVLEPWAQYSARFFLLLTALELLAAPGSAFLISATSSMRGFMQLPGWPTLTVESP
jgi:hypothetical protein